MESFHEVIDAWEAMAELATDLQIATSHVRTMRSRDSIPARFWAPLAAAAQRRGIKGVTIESLAKIKTAQAEVETEPEGGPRQPEPKPPEELAEAS
ncbi:hypothetical protein LCGC14_1760610 [marine sediment metagenome]|uniref:Uncharacterized protein n=1 Tax=marine sediment metagenome TaxID=412755 RepID=A0A0F9K0U2_9ZZZZ